MKELDTKKFRFTPCFEVISRKYKSHKSKVYDKVFGVIYRYASLNNGVCYASVIDTLAPAIGITPKIFGETVEILIKDELITLLEKGHTNKYIPNIEMVEQLLEDAEEINGDNIEIKNKKKGIPKSLSKKYLLRLQVDTTQASEEIIPQLEVDNTLKETELRRESLRESSDLSEASEGRTPSSVPPDSVETKVSPSSPGTDSSIKEAIEEFMDSLSKKINIPLHQKSKLETVSSDNSSETVLKTEETKLASSDVDTSSESIEKRLEKLLASKLDKKIKARCDEEYHTFYSDYAEILFGKEQLEYLKSTFLERLERYGY